VQLDEAAADRAPVEDPAVELVDSQPELEVAKDLLRHAVWVAPVLVAGSGLVWGVDGMLSSLFGVALVLANLVLAAALMGWAAKISPTVLMAVAFGGFFVRMGLVLTALVLVQKQSWVVLAPLAITIIVTHLGLLLWETKYVSLSLAYPGLKPQSPKEIDG
jgi:hypothetical protein